MLLGKLSRIKKYIQNTDGIAAIEFALVAPILIFLIVATVDIGSYVMEDMKLQNTAHATAEYVAMVQSDSNAQTVAAESYRGNPEEITVSSSFSCECADGTPQACPLECGADDYQRRFVTVSVDAAFTPLFPYPGTNDVNLQGLARMRVD